LCHQAHDRPGFVAAIANVREGETARPDIAFRAGNVELQVVGRFAEPAAYRPSQGRIRCGGGLTRIATGVGSEDRVHAVQLNVALAREVGDRTDVAVAEERVADAVATAKLSGRVGNRLDFLAGANGAIARAGAGQASSRLPVERVVGRSVDVGFLADAKSGTGIDVRLRNTVASVVFIVPDSVRAGRC